MGHTQWGVFVPNHCTCPAPLHRTAPLHVPRTSAHALHLCTCLAPLHVSCTSTLHHTSAPAPHLCTAPYPTPLHQFAPLHWICTILPLVPSHSRSTPFSYPVPPASHRPTPAPHLPPPFCMQSHPPFTPALHYPMPFSPAINTGAAPSHTRSVPVPVPCNTILAPYRGHTTDVSWTLVLIVMDTTTQHVKSQEVFPTSVSIAPEIAVKLSGVSPVIARDCPGSQGTHLPSLILDP
jgi:hypothetical protein